MKDAEEKAREIIFKWKHRWYAQWDYRERASGIDANMKHNLALDFAQALREAHASGQTEGFASGRREGLEEAAITAEAETRKQLVGNYAAVVEAKAGMVGRAIRALADHADETSVAERENSGGVE